jgi:hypothetical protein
MVAETALAEGPTTTAMAPAKPAPHLNKPLPQEPPHSPVPPIALLQPPRTDPAGITLRQHNTTVAALSDYQVLQASIRSGITSPPPAKVHLTQPPAKIVNSENLRSQLAEFNAFTQLTTPSPESQKALQSTITQSSESPRKLSDRRPELWVRESQSVPMHKKGTGLGEGDDGIYKWVFFRDLEGVIRSSCPRDGNAMVKTYRRTRFPSRLKRWRNFSFNGRDAQPPWETHQYVNLLAEEIRSLSDTERVKTTRSSTTSTYFDGKGRRSGEAYRKLGNKCRWYM